MNSVPDNALLLLRLMIDGNFVINRDIETNKLKELSGLDDIAYHQAETYLFQQRLIDGMGGSDGTRLATSLGIDHVTQVMRTRILLSVNAERILSIIDDKADKQRRKRIYVDEAATMSMLDIEETRKAFQELDDEGLIESPMRPDAYGRKPSVFKDGAVTSPEGRKAIKRNFQQPQAPATQIGAIFNAPVTTQNLAAAINSTIEQTVNQNDPSAIRQAIDETLKSLTAIVIPQLELNQQLAYSQAVSQLKTELETSTPNSSLINRLIRVVTFADNFNGTLELGEKVFQLGIVTAPYVPILFEQIRNLLTALGNPP